MRSSTGLVASKTSKIDVRRYFAVGDRVSAILHIHDTLCIAAKEGGLPFRHDPLGLCAHLHD